MSQSRDRNTQDEVTLQINVSGVRSLRLAPHMDVQKGAAHIAVAAEDNATCDALGVTPPTPSEPTRVGESSHPPEVVKSKGKLHTSKCNTIPV